MKFYAGHSYHIYNQGNNREKIFYERENYLYFLKKLKSKVTPHSDILAWCLMPNHYHLLVQVKTDYYDSEKSSIGKLNQAIGSIQSSYTQAINKKYQRSGSLFRQRAKDKAVDVNSRSHDDYLLNCFLYIHQNPLRAGLVERLEDWEFSSYRDFIGRRSGELCNKQLALELLNIPNNLKEFERFSYQTIPEQFN
ncbi:transposase [Balneola vulgaris]|jgi:REP element-mobilizing transposase RayT|uniref:transposase n=1 Tax=Balneola vulgaris TaxID=287535 RepID=UPI000378ADB3|nr:transposase [Balneola vulgaris]